MANESTPILPSDILSEAVEQPVSRMRKRPAPAYDLRLRKKRRKKPVNPDDPDDPDNPDDPDDETDDTDPDDDDDDDGTTGSGTDDEESGGDEDENELQQIDTRPKQQMQNPFQQQKPQPEKNTMKEKPKGPEKTERSPWQQMIDFLVHGAKGAMIKNGDVSTKTSLADQIMAGLGFKSFKKDIMLQEQAKEFWQQKASGKKADMRLLNTDLIDRKIRDEEKREQQPQKQFEQQQMKRQKDTVQLQRDLSQRISKQRREENIRIQTERQSMQLKQQGQNIAAQQRDNATRIAQNELTMSHADTKRLKIPSVATPEIVRTDGTKIAETGVKNTQTISAEQTRQRQEQAQINNKQNTEAQQIMAQQAALNAQQPMMSAQQAAVAATTATLAMQALAERAQMGHVHAPRPIRPRPLNIMREQVQLNQQQEQPFNAYKVADEVIKKSGGLEKMAAEVNNRNADNILATAGQSVSQDSNVSDNSANATLANAGQVHQENQPNEAKQQERG